LPVPLFPEVIVIQDALLTAVHWQFEVAVTLTLPVSAPAPWFLLAGEIEKLQALGLTVILRVKEPSST
jgi:hypothetical protein